MAELKQDQGLTTADIANPKEPESDRDLDAADLGASGDERLLSPADADRFNSEWKDVQTGFVDHPRQAVEQADRLVADLMQRLATEFSETRANLERQWDVQDDISTEDLRLAMTRYRSFFERLLET
ncbi:MAG TPA: hypothetical protein VH063_01640 [Gaiellaceae bacterium]|nr:hypothetical protein [Gaiellaceae bacterium]